MIIGNAQVVARTGIVIHPNRRDWHFDPPYELSRVSRSGFRTSFFPVVDMQPIPPDKKVVVLGGKIYGNHVYRQCFYRISTLDDQELFPCIKVLEIHAARTPGYGPSIEFELDPDAVAKKFAEERAKPRDGITWVDLINSPGGVVVNKIEKGLLRDYYFSGLIFERPRLIDLKAAGVDVNLTLARNAA